MTNIKLIAIDLDNTLFDDHKKVSPLNLNAIRQAKENGVKVVVTTGRPLAAIGDLLADLGLNNIDDYCITFNGGLIQRNDGKILHAVSLSRNDIIQIADILTPFGLPVDVISDDTVYSLPVEDRHSRYPEANPLLDFVVIDQIGDLPVNENYQKVVVVTDSAFLDQAIKRLPMSLFEDFETFKSRDIIFEIMPKGIHKATGLQYLSQQLAFQPEEVMAIGDEENDLTMLTWAGLGVAMANASQKVKSVANVVTTKDNNQSGVAEAINKYVLSEDKNGII